MKENLKKILEFSIFLSIASLPFIAATSMLGIDTFLDSFENPESYVYLKNSDSVSGITTDQDKYIIIQKQNHPDFEIQKKDTILYFKFDGELAYNKINEINGVGAFTRYYTDEENQEENIVFANQIVGKIIKVLDENILTDLSIKIWDISISNLNIESIL